jgi:tetratricopeptide (TPR) repeat protein
MFLALVDELHEPETSAMAARLATTRERRAAELMAEAEALPATDAAGRAKKTQAATTLYGQAAEDYLLHSKLMTLEDTVSGNSLWHAAQLFDKAGQTTSAIDAYNRFITERPRDSRTPEGLLEMGRLYQSVGQIDQAIPIYQRNIKENGKTPAAYASAVNLARCYMAQGPAQFELAEKSLLSLVQDNLDLDPTANEFRTSLFTLGELYYDNNRWADAILRLEEAVDRYPSDKAVPRALFMLGESYRKSAADIQDAIEKNPAIEHRDALSKARLDRLRRAATLFAKVIGALDVDAEQAIAGQEPHLSPLESDYLRTSYMDRAECYFQLGDFPLAIKYYDQTATRFAQHVMAIESYVQIVNCYRAMNQPAQANAAAERAQWILKRIPEEAFAKSPAPLNRQYFEEFFKLGRNRQGAT